MWVLSLVLGEALAITAELVVAKGRLLPGVLLGLVGLPCLLFGYWLGVKTGTVWKVSAVSIGAIVLAEPALVWLFFRQWPSKWELVACLLGVAGMLVALLAERPAS